MIEEKEFCNLLVSKIAEQYNLTLYPGYFMDCYDQYAKTDDIKSPLCVELTNDGGSVCFGRDWVNEFLDEVKEKDRRRLLIQEAIEL